MRAELALGECWRPGGRNEEDLRPQRGLPLFVAGGSCSLILKKRPRCSSQFSKKHSWDLLR